ncbi:MAG: hypothetical protein K0S38_935 [Candidatus Paceibacter sp.]|nr:hypothetical protein [Candidatus Paceibacter sp.]
MHKPPSNLGGFGILKYMRKAFYIIVGILFFMGLMSATFTFVTGFFYPETSGGTVHPFVAMGKLALIGGGLLIIHITLGVLAGMYYEKLSRAWASWKNGLVFGLLVSLAIIIASLRSEEEIPMSGVIFGVVMLTLICVGIAAAYGAIKKKMKKPDQVSPPPTSTQQ